MKRNPDRDIDRAYSHSMEKFYRTHCGSKKYKDGRDKHSSWSTMWNLDDAKWQRKHERFRKKLKKSENKIKKVV